MIKTVIGHELPCSETLPRRYIPVGLDEPSYTELTQLAAAICRAPIAAISLVDGDRLWFKARVGIDLEQGPSERSCCAVAIRQQGVLTVHDAHVDPRFREWPLVANGIGLRFYAGASLHQADGPAPGTLWVGDRVPRDLTEDQRVALRTLADQITTQMELQRCRTELERAEGEVQRLGMIADGTDNAVIITDREGRIEWVNRSFTRVTEYTLAEALGRKPGALLQGPETDPEIVQYMHDRLSSGRGFVTEAVNYSRSGRKYWAAIEAQPVLEPGGAVMNFVGITSDISERRDAAARLEEQARMDGLRATVAAALINRGELPELLRQCCEALVSHLDAAFARVWTYNEAEQVLELQASAGMYTHVDGPHGRAPLGKFKIGRIAEERLPHLTNQVTGDPRVGDQEWAKREAMVAFAGYPLVIEDRLVGVMALFARQPLPDCAINVLETIADQVALAIHHKHAEEDLRRLSSLQQAILAGANYAIISTSVDGTIQTWNRTAEKMLGYSAEEMVGHQTPAVIHDPAEVAQRADELSVELGETVTPGFETFVARARKGMPDEREWTYIRKDGTRIPVLLSITSLHDEQGILTGFLGIASEISERKQVEVKLSQLAAIVESSNDAIVAKTLDGRIQSWNAAAEALFGYTAAEVVGRPITILYPQERVNDWEHIIRCLRQGVRVKHFETVRIRKDGTAVDVSLTVSPIRDSGGRVVGASKIARDITDRKRADRMKNEFISTVSHELRTPLTSIRGALGLIQGGAVGELPPRARPLVDIAVKNSDRLVRLINDILDVERMAAGKIEFHLKPTPVVGLVEEAIAANQVYAHQLGVSLMLEEAPEEVLALADRDRMMQALTNLLSNAAKFSPSGEAVRVSVTRRESMIRIAVADRGPGIPDEFRSRVFERFSQADSSDTRQKGGTGLGLNITRTIVEKHHGRVGFDSTPGEGSVFSIDLPGLSQEVSVPKAKQESEEESRPHILVCEDDPDIARLLCMVLAEAGFSSEIATDGPSALQCLARRRYDALTLDLMLPGMSGAEVFQEIRQDENLRNLPVIVISARVGRGQAEDGSLEVSGVASGVVDWLTKPIEPSRLTAALQSATRQVGSGSEATRCPRTGLPRVLHVDDDPDVLQVVAGVLEGVADVVPAASLGAARRCLEQDDVQLALLDLDLPDGSGLELLPLLESRAVPIPAVIFSATEVPADTSRKVFASLVKSRTGNADLVAAIRSVVGGNA